MASEANASPTAGAGSPKPPGAPRGRALMNTRGMAARREVQPTQRDDPGKMAFGDFEWNVDDAPPSSPPSSSSNGGGSKQQTPVSSRSSSRDESGDGPSERTSRGSSLGNEQPYPRRPSSPNNPKPTSEGRSGRLGWGSSGPTTSNGSDASSSNHRSSGEEVHHFHAGIRPKTPPKVDSPGRESSTESQPRPSRLHPTFLVEDDVKKQRQPLELSGSGSTNSNPDSPFTAKPNALSSRGSAANLSNGGLGRSVSFGTWGSAGAAWNPMGRRGSASTGGGGTPTQKVEEEIEYETLSFGDVEYKVPKRKEQANHHRHSLVSAMIDEVDIAVLAKDLNQKEEERLLDEDGDCNSLGSGGDDLEAETDSEELEAELLKPADENELVPTATTAAAASALNDSPMNASAKSQLQQLGHSGRLGQSPSVSAAAIVPARDANPITFFGDFSLTDDSSSDGNPMNFGRGKNASDEKGGGDGKPTFAFGDFGAAADGAKQISPGTKSLSFSGSKRTGLLPPVLTWRVFSFLGHSGRVRSLVSCDAKDAHIVSTGGDQRSVTARREGFPHLVARYSPHKGIVLHTSISADGRFLATSGNDECLCVHDNQTSKRLAVMRHPEAVTCSAFADNGRFIITGCHDGVCRLYSVQGAGPLRTVTFSKDSIITCVALHPTGEFAASGSSEGNVFVWRSASGALIPMCQEHTLKRQVILQVAFTRKGALLAVLDRFMLTFTLVPSGHPVLTVKSQDIPFIATRLSEAGLNFTTKGKAGKRFLPHHGIYGGGGGGGPGHSPNPGATAAAVEFQFTAMHCGQVDNRIRSLPDSCVALAGNDREVRCYDFAGFFEEFESLHSSLIQEMKGTAQAANDQARKAKRLSGAKTLDRNDHEAVEDSFVPSAVLQKPLLSFTCRGAPCAMSPGRSGALLVGDVLGNIAILRVNHTSGYKEKPPPSELAKIRREKALSSPPKGMS